MEKQFILYEQALKLKELGFSEKCLATIDQTEYFHINGTKNSPRGSMMYDTIALPLWQQAFDWFREKHNLQSFIIRKTPTNWYYNIERDYFINGNEYFNTYQEAQLFCLDKLIEIVEQQNK